MCGNRAFSVRTFQRCGQIKMVFYRIPRSDDIRDGCALVEKGYSSPVLGGEAESPELTLADSFLRPHFERNRVWTTATRATRRPHGSARPDKPVQSQACRS